MCRVFLFHLATLQTNRQTALALILSKYKHFTKGFEKKSIDLITLVAILNLNIDIVNTQIDTVIPSSLVSKVTRDPMATPSKLQSRFTKTIPTTKHGGGTIMLRCLIGKRKDSYWVIFLDGHFYLRCICVKWYIYIIIANRLQPETQNAIHL